MLEHNLFVAKYLLLVLCGVIAIFLRFVKMKLKKIVHNIYIDTVQKRPPSPLFFFIFDILVFALFFITPL